MELQAVNLADNTAPTKPIDDTQRARLAAIAKLPRHKHAPSETIHFRDPDDPGKGLVGFGISGNKKLTTGFMERALRALHLTIPQFKAWTGYASLGLWITNNPSWSERQWFELVCENLDTIRAATD